MLLQTNSYVVPKEKRAEHARLLQRFRQTLTRLGCEHFEAYEQVSANWAPGETTGRFVQLMRFRDRKHQQQVQAAEKSDPVAQQLIKEFCDLIDFPRQQQQGLFAVGFYQGIMALSGPARQPPNVSGSLPPESAAPPTAPPPVPAEDIHPPDVHGETPAGASRIEELNTPTQPAADGRNGELAAPIDDDLSAPTDDEIEEAIRERRTGS